ncbi:putative ribonuclease H-like domain-containing protein [Tanacetum coccineum]
MHGNADGMPYHVPETSRKWETPGNAWETSPEKVETFLQLRFDQGVGSTSGIRACALRYFDLGKNGVRKFSEQFVGKASPILKLGEYEMWEIRIKQYFQIQDYALWEVIENGNSWVPIPVTAPESGPSTALKMTVPSTTEEKICKKNDVKARTRFGGNDATKKTQKALLKQQYENFNATSSESLDSIFNRLQKLVSRLAILGVDTPPEDLNVKFFRSLPSEWDTHVVVWMNKPDFDTMGLDDLYNNFKIVEQKVKRTAAANNDDKNLAFLTTSSPSSTNTINTVNTGVSTGNTKVNTASTETSTASFSDATVYAFLSTQPQGSELVHEDLEQLHDDDLEEMDLKWNMALLSMRARKFYQRTGRKIIIDGSSTAGYDKSKVECFNCHKMGHFARECRAPRSKDNRNWNQGSSSKAVRIEDASEKAMCAIDGAGFDWSDMAEDEIQANMALMAFTDSEVSNDKSCSKSCLQNYEALKKQYDDLLVKLDDTGFKAATYKRGLSILEAQVVKYKESEVLFSEEIALLKRSVGHKEYLMGLLKTELEKVKEEKEGPEEFKQPEVSDDEEYVEIILKVEKKIPTATKKESVKTVNLSRRSVSFHHIQYNCPNAYKHMVPRAVLMKTGLKTVKNAKPLSTVRSVNTARPFSTARPNVNTVRARGFNAVKPSACWVWRPIKPNGASLSNSQLNDKGFVDSGCSRHMSGNIAHLSDFKDFDGGYVTFGGGANGGRITGKGSSYYYDASFKSLLMHKYRDQDGTHGGIVVFRDNDTQRRFKALIGDSFHHLMQFLLLLIQEFTRINQFDHVIWWMCTSSISNLGRNDNNLISEQDLLVPSMKEETTRTYIHAFCLYLSQEEPKQFSKSLSDPAWVEAMQEESSSSSYKILPPPHIFEKSPWVKDAADDEVDEHLYNNDWIWIILSNFFFRPDIMVLQFVHVARISIGVSLLTLIVTYAGATLDRKSTTGGCQFLGNRLIFGNARKQSVVATSTTKAEYVAAASCWLLNVSTVWFLSINTASPGLLQELTSPEQTAPGKDFPNPLIVDSLLKTNVPHAPFITISIGLSRANGYLRGFIRSSISSIEVISAMHLLRNQSPKKTDWEQFSSNIGAAVYPTCLDMPETQASTTHKPLFCSSLIMKCLAYEEIHRRDFQSRVALFPTMLDATEPSPSPSRITSSPSPTPSPSPASSPSQPSPTPPTPTQPSPTQLSPTQPGTEYHPPTPHDSPLHAVHSHGKADLLKTKKTYSSAYTKLILRVKKLESQVKIGKARKQTRVVISDDEAFEDDSSKQGRKLFNEEVQEKASTETELFIQEVTPTEVIQDQEGSGKASDEVSTAGLKKGTASEEVPTVSTAEVHLSTAGGTVTYSRRSAEKRSRQDKGKAILIEEEPKKKSKKELEQERLSYAEAIRLEEQMNEEQRAQIARDAEIARQWHEEERKRAMDEAKTTKKIDWNDPFTIRYHFPPQKNKPKTMLKLRRNMNQIFEQPGNFKIKSVQGNRKKVKSKSLLKKEGASKFPEGYDLMLWGDLHTMFEPNEDDELWKNQHQYNLISWSLYDFCGIHMLLMENGMAIHMLTEKRYPLSQDMISKMLKNRLEVDHESTQAIELLRFIRSQVFERIISRGRRLEDFIQKKLDDLKDNHKFRGGLLGINLHMT